MRLSLSLMSKLFLQIVVVLSLLMANVALAKTSVWTVTKGDHKLYIAGTIHMLKPSDFPYPRVFDLAYQRVEQVVFETDIDAISRPEFGLKMMELSIPKDRLTLKDRLSPKVFEALKSYTTEQGVPIVQINPMTPAFAALSLVTFKYQSLGYQAGVDDYYFKKASDDKKGRLFLETPEEQLGFITAINNVDADELILSTLQDLDALDELGDAMTLAWRRGDSERLFELVGDMKTDFPDMYSVMLTERNQKWLTDIETIYQSRKPTLVLVGALHLAGPDSVLAMLEARGYTVEYARFKETITQLSVDSVAK